MLFRDNNITCLIEMDRVALRKLRTVTGLFLRHFPPRYACLALPFSSSAGLDDHSAFTSLGIAALARPAAALATAILLYAWLPQKQQLRLSHVRPPEGSLKSKTHKGAENKSANSQFESKESVRGPKQKLELIPRMKTRGFAIGSDAQESAGERTGGMSLRRLSGWLKRSIARLASLSYGAYLLHVSIIGALLIAFEEKDASLKDHLDYAPGDGLCKTLILVSSRGLVLSFVVASLLSQVKVFR